MAEKRWHIETPQRIRFSHVIAGIGSRVAAYLIDAIIQFILIFLLILAASLASMGYDNVIQNFSNGFALLLLFLVQWWYFLLFEWFMDGRTPGKMTQKIRVIRENGSPFSFPVLVLRNFLRAVDNFPVVPLVGGIIALIHPLNKRLGDMVAGTLVVEDNVNNLPIPDTGILLEGVNSYDLNLKAGITLNENQLRLIRDFLILQLPKGAYTASDELAMKVGDELQCPWDGRGSSAEFLKAVYRYHATAK